MKVGVIIAVTTGMLGALSAAINAAHSGHHPWLADSCAFIAFLLLCSALVFAALAVRPQTEGPPRSFIYFGKITSVDRETYIANFKSAAPEDLLADCLAQIHRNAEIARDKYTAIRRAIWLDFGAIIPWAIAMAAVSKPPG